MLFQMIFVYFFYGAVGSHFNDRGYYGHGKLCDIDDFRIYPIIQCPSLDTEENTDKNRKEMGNLQAHSVDGTDKQVGS